MLLLQGTLCSAIDVNAFYRVFSSGNMAEVNTCIKQLESAEPTPQINAYRGAMLMKKAGLEKTPKDKLSTFKLGHKLLEAEISKAPDNTEFRFLRLAIQESAPAILKYKKNLQEDKSCIVKGYKKLEPDLQGHIAQECKQSRVLTAKDLQ